MLEIFNKASWAGKTAACAFLLAKTLFIFTIASILISKTLALAFMTLYILSVTASVGLAVYDIYILKTWDDGYTTPMANVQQWHNNEKK